MAVYTVQGSNLQVSTDDYPAFRASILIVGTAGDDTQVVGGRNGNARPVFLGSAGNDLYAVESGVDIDGNLYAPSPEVQYTDAPSGVSVDLTIAGGSRTFTDASGDVRTVKIWGMALDDGFGGTDYFTRSVYGDRTSAIQVVIGSAFDDKLVGGAFSTHSGEAGNDTLVGGRLSGGEGDDLLTAKDNGFTFLEGGGGNDVLRGVDSADGRLVGGAGDDRIYARGGDDGYVTGDAGDDYVNGGAGDDFIDGGVGADVLYSGAGSDTINPDVEFFQGLDDDYPTDGARDVVWVTAADLGDYTDVVLGNSNAAFEAGLDEIRFRKAVSDGQDYRIYYENEDTVLQIDHNGDGFGVDVVDATDYFMIVRDVTLTEQAGYLLT